MSSAVRIDVGIGIVVGMTIGAMSLLTVSFILEATMISFALRDSPALPANPSAVLVLGVDLVVRMTLGAMGDGLLVLAFFGGHILRVVLLRAEEQMRRIDAGSIVTLMADAETVWDWAIV